MSERHDTRIYDEAHAKGFAEGWAKALRATPMSGIPWRFDLENMPKDGSRFLAWEGAYVVPEDAVCVLRWSKRSQTFLRNNRPIYGWSAFIAAWCPIDKPDLDKR